MASKGFARAPRAQEHHTAVSIITPDFENKTCGAAFNAEAKSSDRTPGKRWGGEGKLQTFIDANFLRLIKAVTEESRAELSRSLPCTPAPITAARFEQHPDKPTLLKQNCVPMVTARIFCRAVHVMQEARVTRLIC